MEEIALMAEPLCVSKRYGRMGQRQLTRMDSILWRRTGSRICSPSHPLLYIQHLSR